MPRIKLALVQSDFLNELRQANSLLVFVRSAPGASSAHLQLTAEMAFLRGYVAWESFLDASFTLYLLGKSSPSNFRPSRFVSPSSRAHAIDIGLGEMRYLDWTAPDKVSNRAKRFFDQGQPFVPAIASIASGLLEMKTIRNYIAHTSGTSISNFESLVRKELGHFPVHTSAGMFLLTPKANPPTAPSYLDYYFTLLISASQVIVP